MSNVLYGIHCKICQHIVYVGKTGSTINERFQNNLSCIRRKNTEPIAQHFMQETHKIGDLRIVGIEKIKQMAINMCKIRESFWIAKLQMVDLTRT